MIRFDRAVYPFIAGSLGAAIVGAILVSAWVSLPFLLLTGFFLFFFRDPDRRITATGDVVLSPADGRVLVAGGTGLYVRALTHGISDLPAANAKLREQIESVSLDELQGRYAALDPEGAARIDLKNTRRLVRALEVCLLTGKPFSTFREEWSEPKCAAGVLLTRDRAELNSRINERVLQMFKHGLLDEVRSAENVGATAEQAIGFREARACLRGDISQAEAIAQIQQATRRYAKRQLTWFRRERSFELLNLTTLSPESAIELIAQKARSLSTA